MISNYAERRKVRFIRIIIIMKTILYYFTGTGNSLYLTQQLSVLIPNSEIRCVTEYKGNVHSKCMIGIIFPVYMWTLPNIITDFANKLKYDDSCYVFSIANYGGLPGKALQNLDELLKKNNSKSLSAGFYIHMPGNYYPMYGGLSEEKQKKLFAEAKKKLVSIAEKLKDQPVLKPEKSHAVIDSIMYKALSKNISTVKESDSNYIVNDKCKGCGVCVSKCPVNNIKLENNKPVWMHNCEACMACLQYCPNGAIGYKGVKDTRKRYTNPLVK